MVEEQGCYVYFFYCCVDTFTILIMDKCTAIRPDKNTRLFTFNWQKGKA